MDTIAEILKYSLISVFFFFVYNTSPLGEFARNFINKQINAFSGRDDLIGWFSRKFAYLTRCCFCVTFWLTSLLWCFRIPELYVVFCAPVIAPIIHKALIMSLLPIQFQKPKEIKNEPKVT